MKTIATIVCMLTVVTFPSWAVDGSPRQINVSGEAVVNVA